MAGKAIVIGSGPAGSVAAMVLAEHGWNVVILEKGRNHFGDLRSPTPQTQFSNDELKESRSFQDVDVELEPRTFRRHATDTQPLVTGFVNQLPSTVGGGAVHWDAKTPRLWDIDFKKRSLLGPIPGADIQDWPFLYAEIAPYYEEVERLIGVQGRRKDFPALTLKHAPRAHEFVMPPGPPQYSSLLQAGGAETLGLHPFPTPMAINSVRYDGRPACNNCGFCAGYGCPIHARVGGLAPLRRALLTGRTRLKADAFVSRIHYRGRRATGVTYSTDGGRSVTEGADLVVLAASAIESARLALLSGLPNPNHLIGKYLMFHWFTDGAAIFPQERVHAYRGRSTSHGLDDFADPEFPGSRAFAQANGLPYFRGGALELGGSQEPISEAMLYKDTFLPLLSPEKPFGAQFKNLMRASLFRDRFAGIQMIGEDLPQVTNFVDLDPRVKDIHGVPVARITYSPHKHEIAAQRFYIPWITAILKAAGAAVAFAVPATSSDDFPIGGSGDAPSDAHIMGGMRMGNNPKTSVTDQYGRLHALDNLFVTDASVFPTSGAHNPTLTIMATALRSARHFAR